MRRHFPLLALLAFWMAQALQAQDFKLAPALALEAEDFQVESGWKVVQNGQGNYMVDIIGFNHISGERLLCLEAAADSSSAFLDVTLPEAGKYRLWVRYEYPAFCETKFRIQIMQEDKTVLDQVMGTRDNLRYGFGNPKPLAQHDPSWGPEGLFEEAVTTPELKAGKARLYLKGTPQAQIPGVAAGRHIDLIYLTRDLSDTWIAHYQRRTGLYPILDAFRDTRGPRYEVRFFNQGDKPADYRVQHIYNRIPWGESEGLIAKGVKPGEMSAWFGLKAQDTAHFGMVQFSSSGQSFEVEIRPVGGTVERKLAGPNPLSVYLPPYPGKGDRPVTPLEQIDAILKDLAAHKPPGKKPTQPLCYGGWMPLGLDSDYGRKYAQLYAALGMRSLHPALSGPAALKNLEAAGVPPTRSWAVMGYRNPPTAANIQAAQRDLARNGMEKYLQWYDYGDEISFSEWMNLLIQSEVDRAKAAGKPVPPAEVVTRLWLQWLKNNRPTARPADYWLDKWGNPDITKLKPDSSSEAARLNPRLYVDSLLFYEEVSIAHVAAGAKAVRQALGEHVLCGANYSCHPFYYPSSTMYIKWFRAGAADLGRHSEYFWQVAQPGPMINGYIAEHFRSGMRNNPRAVLRQYTMPHAPGNTDASFWRSAFSHLAHGATMLDFFGIGLNECFTENHIDHRAVSRFRVVRDVTHAVGFVEDLLPGSRPVASPVGLLISESSERWDFAGIAQDRAGHDHFGVNFRQTRLHHHLERLGLWTALTFLGSSADLLIEADINAKLLGDYKVLVLVGDCLPPALAGELDKWVRKGGVVLAVAGTGRLDPYRQSTAEFDKLFGLASRRTDERSTFFRPRQELPFLKPVGSLAGASLEMPALATHERIGVGKETTVLGTFVEDKSPAFVMRRLGNGQVFYVAALPGVASLWSALQPPAVPDRGPGTHTVPTTFDKGARDLLAQVLKAAAIEPAIRAEPSLIDARLLRAPVGYLLPLANYHDKVGQKVSLSIRVDGPVSKVVSAYHGELPVTKENGRIVVTLPELGYGDILRLTP